MKPLTIFPEAARPITTDQFMKVAELFDGEPISAIYWSAEGLVVEDEMRNCTVLIGGGAAAINTLADYVEAQRVA
jgi:hypothetical protein